MIERPIEARLRAFYREEAPFGLLAPPELADSVDRIPDGTPAQGRVDRRRLTLLLVAALLAVLVAGTALALASGLLPVPWTPPDRPVPALGLGRDCGPSQRHDLLVQMVDGGGSGTAMREVRLYADGRVVEIRPSYASFEAEFRQLLLTDAGVTAMLTRIREAGVVAGCRSLFADADERSVHVWGPEGMAAIGWGRVGGVRPLGAAELGALDRLVQEIADPASWMPAPGLTTTSFEPFVPNRWRVHVQILDTMMQPGEGIQTAEGLVFAGSNPDFRNLRLPGGVPPEEYGEPEGGDQAIRCGEVEFDEAASLVESLAAARASHVPNDVWEVFSEDLSTSYVIQVIAMVSDAEGCAYVAFNPVDHEPTPTPAPAPEEDLADVDPCVLVADAFREVAAGELTRHEARLPLDGRSSACSAPVDQGYSVIDVTLRSRSTSLDEARWWVEALFGPRVVELPVHGGIAWENECLAEALPCERAIALLARDHLFVVELSTGPEETQVDIRELVRRVAASMASAPQ